MFLPFCKSCFFNYFNRPFVLHPWSYAFGKSNLNLTYTTIGETLKERAKLNGDKKAVTSVYENIEKTFDQFDEEVDTLSKSFEPLLGLKKGDVVALWSANCYNWLLIQHACARFGLILCTLNPVYKAVELEYSLIKSEAKVLFLPGLNSNQESVNQFSQIFSTLDPSKLSLKKTVFIDGSVVKVNNIQAHYLEDLMKNNSNSSLSFEHISSDDPAIIMFTSVNND